MLQKLVKNALAVLFLLQICTAFELVADGGFDQLTSWNITPAVALCHGWCHYANVWNEPAHSGFSFVFANPLQGAVYMAQRFYTQTEYNRCDFSAYLRVIDAVNADVILIWDSTIYRVDMMELEKESESSSSEWVRTDITLYGSSQELEIRLQTAGLAYISLDDVSLNCYIVEFYEDPEAQVLIVILLVAIFIGAISLWYRKSSFDICACSTCCSEKPVYLELEIEKQKDVSSTETFDGAPLPNDGTFQSLALATLGSHNSSQSESQEKSEENDNTLKLGEG